MELEALCKFYNAPKSNAICISMIDHLNEINCTTLQHNRSNVFAELVLH